MSKGEAKAPKTEKAEAKAPLVAIDRGNYVAGRTATGTKSLNNGDPVAAALAGIGIDDLYTVAEKVTGTDHRERYAKLNVGMQRMNLGNRIRGAISKLDKENAKSEKPGAPGIDRLVKLTDPLQKAAQKAADAEAKAKQAEAEAKAKAAAAAKKEKADKKAHKAKASAA
jgi:colicin import membrane protein